MTSSDNMTIEQKRNKVINVDIYSTKLEVCITVDVIEHYKALCHKYHYIPSDETIGKIFRGLYTLLDHHFILIDEKYMSHNTLSHELHHAARRITRSIGVNDEEADAWLHGYLTGEVYKFLDKEKYKITHGK